MRDEIAFGYNLADHLPASRVLADGIGQRNTKGSLFMALLRACGIPCRLHGFTIDKALQKGAITGIAYHLAPRSIVHCWVAVWFEGRWLELEGFILDSAYLRALQQRFTMHQGAFCGYGAAKPDLHHPPVDWQGGTTYIQKDGINHDFGVFEDPDAFYAPRIKLDRSQALAVPGRGAPLDEPQRGAHPGRGMRLMRWAARRCPSGRALRRHSRGRPPTAPPAPSALFSRTGPAS